MVAKRKKTTWRKDIDLSKVEDDLSVGKERERLVGKDSKDESLFVVDKTGDDRVRKQVKKMRIDEILNPQSKIVVPPSKVRPATKSFKRAVSSSVPKKILKKVQNQSEKSKAAVKPKSSLNLWSQEYNDTAKVKPGDYVLDPKVQVPVKRKTDLPRLKSEGMVAVKVAHQGSSYRPDAKSYKELVDQIVTEEQEKEVLDAKVKASLVSHKVIRSMKQIDTDGLENLLMAKTASLKDLIESGEAEGNSEESVAFQAPASKRKSRSQRNKEKELKEALLQSKEEKLMGKLEKQVDNIERIESHLRKAVKASAKRPKRSKQVKPFGKFRFQPEVQPVQLPEQLTDSLRKLKPEGNIFTDRFKSLQERGIIEARLPTSIRPKFRRKFFEMPASRHFS